MVTVLLLSFPVACLSWTICEAEIFREFREAVHRWAFRRRNSSVRWFYDKLAYVPTCYYCMAHWVGAAFTAWSGAHLAAPGWLGLVTAWLAIVWISICQLTLYHISRAALRGVRAWADEKEAALPRRRNPKIYA